MSPGTPQKHYVIEWGFSTLYYQMCAMMSHAELHENLNTGLCRKCVATATKLENIMVNPHEEKCAYEKFTSKMPDYAKCSNNFV